jgi:arginase
MHAQILGFPTTLGMPRTETQAAPTALRQFGLIGALDQIADVTDLGDVDVEAPSAADSTVQLLQKVISTARRQARAFVGAHDPGALPITLGGDHTTSLGTALALKQLGASFDVVWLDAHGDFNTPVTSPSGNPHGMVLALLAGLTPHLPQIVPPWRVHLWGVRDLDTGERALLHALGVSVWDVPATRTEWPKLLNRLGENVLLSFDCDCCQPDVAPGTRTPVPGGFERAEALAIVQQISESRRVLALDVVELHPDRDRQYRTARLARDVILTAARAQARFRASLAERGTAVQASQG